MEQQEAPLRLLPDQTLPLVSLERGRLEEEKEKKGVRDANSLAPLLLSLLPSLLPSLLLLVV